MEKAKVSANAINMYIVKLIFTCCPCFYGHFPAERRLAGFPHFFVHLLLKRTFGDKRQRFLQARCFSCHPANIVNSL